MQRQFDSESQSYPNSEGERTRHCGECMHSTRMDDHQCSFTKW